MKSYKTWELNEGQFIIEKFIGEYTLKQVIGPIELILSLARKKTPLSILVDLTEAKIGFPSNDIRQLVEIFVEESTDFLEIKFAMVTADEEVQEVAFAFAQESSSYIQLPSMTFHTLNSALEWLSIEELYREKAREILSK